MSGTDPVYPPVAGGQGNAYGGPPPAGLYDNQKQPMPPSYQPAQPMAAPYGQQQQYGQPYGQPMGAPYGQASANTVIVSQPGPVIYQPHNVMPDNTMAVIFSCVVAWCCCFILGIIAFVYAITSRSAGDIQLAYRKLRISRNLSIAGLVTGIALYVFFVALRIILVATA